MNVKSAQHSAPGSLVPLLEQRLEAAKQQERKLQAELEKAREQVFLYERTLDVELVKVAQHVPYGITDKWLLFGRFCELHRFDGFTRPQLAQFFRDQQVAVGKNFPYQAVEKWASRLVQRGDRFFLKTRDSQGEAITREEANGTSSRQVPRNVRPVGDLIKAVEGCIQVFDVIDSRTVYRYLKKQRYSFGAKRPISSIASILRRLEMRGKLIEIQKGAGTYPGQYRKAAELQTSGTEKTNVK